MRAIAVLAAACLLLFSGCQESSPAPSEAPETSAQPETSPATSAPATAPPTEASTQPPTEASPVPAGDFGQADPCSYINDSNIVLIGEDGYYYACETGWYDGPFSVWYRDDRAGSVTELDIPAGITESEQLDYSVIGLADGALWIDHSSYGTGGGALGICTYRDGDLDQLPEPLSSAERLWLGEEGVWSVKGQTLSFSGFSGEDPRELCELDTWAEDMDTFGVYEGKAVWSDYSLELSGYETFAADLTTGGSAPIGRGKVLFFAGDWCYLAESDGLCRVHLDGSGRELLAAGGIADACLFEGKVYYITYDDLALYCLDEKGETATVLTAEELPECNGINRVSTSGGRLFAEGYSGAFWYVIAELRPDGSWEIVHQGEER